jgi:hypothetical protein
MKRSHSAIALLMVMILSGGLTPIVKAAGDNHDTERAVRLSVTARFTPIATIAGSSLPGKGLAIDGRAAYGTPSLWGGELIQLQTGETARVAFADMGQALLADRAMVRFGTASDADHSKHLIASLTNGSLTVKLNQTTGAYVEAGSSRYTASPSAHFRIEMNDGEATLNTVAGTVSVEQQPSGQTRYILRPPAGQGNALSVSARSTRQVQIQVTDENDRPVPDLPILFALDNGCLGTLGVGIGAGLLFKGKTDKRGIATVPWVIGAAKCAGTLVAKVEGTDTAYTYRVQVRTQGFFTTQNTLLVVAGAAAAGVGVGVAVANSGGSSREPITPVPPPDVKP